MKKLTIMIFISLSACGGDYIPREGWEIDYEFCKWQGGTPYLYHVMDIEKDYQFIEVRCKFPKEKDIRVCKPDNGNDNECQ
jgi:hypothetical protein